MADKEVTDRLRPLLLEKLGGRAGITVAIQGMLEVPPPPPEDTPGCIAVKQERPMRICFQVIPRNPPALGLCSDKRDLKIWFCTWPPTLTRACPGAWYVDEVDRTRLATFSTATLPVPHIRCDACHRRATEREIYFKVPAFLCGNTPAKIGRWEEASPVCLLFLASVQFLSLASSRGESPGPH